MILHIPHSGTDTIGRNISDADIIRGTDWFTDELFWHYSSESLVPKISRFVVDCERLPDEIEPMFKKGYGICNTRSFDGIPMVVKDKKSLMNIYNQHHQKLNFLTRKMLPYMGKVFVVDCHSFGDEQKLTDVDVCLGFNDDFNNFQLLEEIKTYLESCNLQVGINTPYSNAIVPSDFYSDERVKSIMIEVNKRTYLDVEDTKVSKSENFIYMKEILNSVLDLISQEEFKDDKF